MDFKTKYNPGQQVYIIDDNRRITKAKVINVSCWCSTLGKPSIKYAFSNDVVKDDLEESEVFATFEELTNYFKH